MSEESMDGPNTHKMAAPSDVTSWTTILTTREVVADDGRGMVLRQEWWRVPSFLVAAIEARSDATAPRDAAPLDAERLRDLLIYRCDPFEPDGTYLYRCARCHASSPIVTEGRAEPKHRPECPVPALSAAPPDPAPASANEVPSTAKLAEWPSAEAKARFRALRHPGDDFWQRVCHDCDEDLDRAALALSRRPGAEQPR